MSAGEIHDVKIVAHSRAIRCVVVAAKNLQLVAPSHCNLCDVG